MDGERASKRGGRGAAEKVTKAGRFTVSCGLGTREKQAAHMPTCQIAYVPD